MDLPVSLAVILALVYGVYQTLNGDIDVYFDAAVTLLFFLLIGRYLDHQMRRRARLAASNLAQLTPRGALELRDDGEPRYIPVAEIDPGKRLLIRTGDRVPVDGTLHSGSAIVDRSLVTGEAEAQEITSNSKLEAGAVNVGPAFELIASASVDGSFLAEIQDLVSTAENGRHRYAALADRVSAAYAPTVHILALVTAVGWFFFSNYNVDAISDVVLI